MSTLTDRYVHAVTQRLQPDQRADIAAELRASIEDTVAGRAPGIDAEQAERATIRDLGDPARLADEYRGAERSLIGPRLYGTWARTMRALLSGVPPIVATVVLVLGAVTEDAVLEIILSALWAAALSALLVAFWVTAGFAIAERVGTEDEVLSSLGAGEGWDLDALPEPADRQVSWGEGVLGVFASVLLIAILTIPGNPIVDNGVKSVPLFTEVAFAGRWVLAAGALISSLAAIAVLIRGRWTWPTALANAAGSVLFAAPLVWLMATDRVLNPTVTIWIDPWGRPQVWAVAALAIALIVLWDVVDALRKAAAAR